MWVDWWRVEYYGGTRGHAAGTLPVDWFQHVIFQSIGFSMKLVYDNLAPSKASVHRRFLSILQQVYFEFWADDCLSSSCLRTNLSHTYIIVLVIII